MIIVTAGDNRHGTNAMGEREDEGVTFAEMIAASRAQAERFGYRIQIYDLGGLGMGDPFSVDDENFRTNGYYRKVSDTYFSKALHKPDIVAACIERHGEFTVYLDGDAVLWKPIDEVVEGDYDIAVTVRSPRELKVMEPWIKQNPEAMGLINAGVIFFRPTDALRAFLPTWKQESVVGGSDQLALNKLLKPESTSAIGTTVERAGVRVKYLAAEQYNYYYFRYGNRPLPDNVRIMHFKANVRGYFRKFFPDVAAGAPTSVGDG